MKRYKLIIQMDAAEGQEEEFLKYYPNVHVADVSKTPGVVSAQFSRRAATMSDSGKHRWDYMVIYELETDDPDSFTALVRERVGAGAIRGNASLMGPERRAVYYEAISEVMP